MLLYPLVVSSSSIIQANTTVLLYDLGLKHIVFSLYGNTLLTSLTGIISLLIGLDILFCIISRVIPSLVQFVCHNLLVQSRETMQGTPRNLCNARCYHFAYSVKRLLLFCKITVYKTVFHCI